MKALKVRARALILAASAVAAGLIGAAVFGQPPPKPIIPPGGKNANKPKVAVKKHDFKDSDIEVVNAKKAIPFKKFDLDELSKLAGKKITANTQFDIDGKKSKAGDYLESLNKAEEKLNAYGYSVRTGLPKGGLQARWKNVKEDPSAFKTQQKQIADLHHKVAPEKDRQAKANIAQHAKDTLPALAKTAQANHEKVEKWRQGQIARLQKV